MKKIDWQIHIAYKIGKCRLSVKPTSKCSSSMILRVNVDHLGSLKVNIDHQYCLYVDCLTSQQHASVPQGWICSDNCTCCHTEIEVADQIFYLTQSQYTDTGPTSPSADHVTPGDGTVATGVPVLKSLV